MDRPYLIVQLLPDPDVDLVTALQAVEHGSLGDSDYSVDELCAVLARPEQCAYLARTAAGEPAGFCSCLRTCSPHGPRLEIDMLGVLPAHRGRGVAGALVAQAVAAARGAGIARFRAVVAEDNHASRRVFTRLGFAGPAAPHTMRVYLLAGLAPLPFLPAGWRWQWAHGPGCAGPGAVAGETGRLYTPGGALAGEIECLEVHTLAYSGLWIERLWAAGAQALQVLARGAAERAKESALDEVGYLLPAALAGEQEDALVAIGYDAVGRYFVLQVDADDH